MAQNYVLLDRIELNASASSVTFSNIPQTGYTDLKIVASTRATGSRSEDSMGIRFNSDSTTANYSIKYLRGNGSAASSGGNDVTAGAYIGEMNGATSTSNTFTSQDIYIPNYTGSNQKSFSVDVVEEANATTAYAQLHAGLWSGTSAITAITFYDYNGNSFVSGSTFSLYGIAAVGTTPAIAPKADGGNVIATDGTYWYHAFLSSGTFTPQVALSADVLVIAGGGGGGSTNGGGGGAGGVAYYVASSLSVTSYTCTIGAGGLGAPSGGMSQASSGANSQFGALTAAVGGGGGGSYSSPAGRSGGSGGGGAAGDVTGVAGAGTSGQGFAGSNSFTGQVGGGGGGSNAAATSKNGANGATTYSSWGAATATGELVGGTYYYAGGGGGGTNSGAGGDATTAGTGGYGGGASGRNQASLGQPTAALINTGGGGGGSGGNGSSAAGGNGGSGIIIIRYPVAS